MKHYNNIIRLLGAMAFVLVLAGCQSQDRYLNNFEKFVTKVETECCNYGDADWARADKQFDDYADSQFERYRKDLTPEQEKLLGRLAARYFKARLGAAFDMTLQEFNSNANILNGFMEEAGESLSNLGIALDELGDSLSDLGDDLSDMVDDLDVADEI